VKQLNRPASAALAIVLMVLSAPRVGYGQAQSSAQAAPATHDFARWEKEIAAFEDSDKSSPPPKNGIVFTGSSTIRMWRTLGQDFPGQKVINRGFGGSEIVDATHFADRIIIPYQPRMVFLRAGGNDIHAGKVPAQILADFQAFVATVHEKLPKTQIIYISNSPAPSRWPENDKYREANRLIREAALSMPFVSYVETFDMVLGPGGSPRPELYINDMLHFNAEGYKLLAEHVRPFMPTPAPGR
jgi:lysophospholipase L1-like esterase